MALVFTSKKPKGEIWMYYTPKNVNQFICNFCKSATFYRNATRMKLHLSSCLKCPKELREKFKKKQIKNSWFEIQTSSTPEDINYQSTSGCYNNTNNNIETIEDIIYNSDGEDGNLLHKTEPQISKIDEEKITHIIKNKTYQPLLKGFIDKMTDTEQVNLIIC